ncbi:MAG: hypothetical protein JEZ06_24925 [Anaerolineaceae bacterium]|nr:hypothetical protein [Anaerolineaceae bacterium]
MSPKTLRTILSILLFVHAIGHGQGIVSSLGLFNSDSWNASSWIFDPLFGQRISKIIAICLFSICLLGFLAVAFSFLNIGIPYANWRTLAIIFSIPSVLGLIAYWNAFAMFFNKAGAIGVNGWILIGIMIMNWPTDADLGL